jgi:hypothetical protein
MDEENFDGEGIIDGLDQDINDSLVRFGDDMAAAEIQLLERIQARLDGLELDVRGNVKKSAANLARINDVRREFLAAQTDGKYSLGVQRLVKGFAVQAQILDGYFTSMRIDYKGGKKLYGAVVDEYITATTAELYTGALAGYVEPQITQILRTHVSAGAPIKQLRQQVAAPFQDRTLAARAETIADNALNQFSRNYMQAVSDDLKLEHYFYKGTLIETSREFCRERVGKYYTRSEVLDWADLKYSGKIKGTDRTNIITNLGGNRCRHRLVPITLALYNAKTGKSGQLSLFQ